LHAIVCSREFFEKGYFGAKVLKRSCYDLRGFLRIAVMLLRTHGGMREGTLFVLVGVEGGDTGYADSRGIGQVFVTFQPDGYANLRFGTNGGGIVRGGGGANHTQNPSPAPNRHALTQGNLRGHS
jgi:hypothetical protein